MADPKKIAVGGHSYGAFMTANLLIHAPHLFCCGISRSGAYNRTLTPFGFQVQNLLLKFNFVEAPCQPLKVPLVATVFYMYSVVFQHDKLHILN